MAKGTRRKETRSEFQGSSGVVGIGVDKTMTELAQQFAVHPNQITDWKRQFSDSAAEVSGKSPESNPPVDMKAMNAKIGQLTLENDFFDSALTKVGLLSAKR